MERTEWEIIMPEFNVEYDPHENKIEIIELSQMTPDDLRAMERMLAETMVEVKKQQQAHYKRFMEKSKASRWN